MKITKIITFIGLLIFLSSFVSAAFNLEFTSNLDADLVGGFESNSNHAWSTPYKATTTYNLTLFSIKLRNNDVSYNMYMVVTDAVDNEGHADPTAILYNGSGQVGSEIDTIDLPAAFDWVNWTVNTPVQIVTGNYYAVAFYSKNGSNFDVDSSVSNTAQEAQMDWAYFNGAVFLAQFGNSQAHSMFWSGEVEAPPTHIGAVDMLFANDSSLTVPKTSFDEGEMIYVFVNWTNATSNVTLNDSVGFCNITLEEGIFEDELDNITTNISLCNNGCTYDNLKVEFNVEDNKSVIDDYVQVHICHNNVVQQDLSINVNCPTGSGVATILQNEFTQCSDGFTIIRKRVSECNQSVKVNVTIDNNANNIVSGHLISEFAFEREFENHTPPTEFDSILQLWVTWHSHQYYKHGTKTIHANCTHNTDPNMDVKTNEQIIIVNIAPLIFFEELNYGGGMLNLTNQMIIEYFSDIWAWTIAVIDDDLDTIIYTFRNSTSIIQVNSSSMSIDIITRDALFLDFSGNPYNLSVTANDTTGNITTSSILFNVTDTMNPVCTDFDNTTLGNGSNYTWNAICTDENFFSLNVSCTGSSNFNFFIDGLQTTSYNFVNTTLITGNTTCLVEYCDGHTLNIIEDIKIGDKFSSSKRTFDDTITIYSDKGFKNFNLNKDSDRYTFDIETVVAQSETTFTVNSNEFIHIMNDIRYSGWLITGDYWIDFENDEFKFMNVTRVSPYSVTVHIVFKKPIKRVYYKSIGKLNCIQKTQLITIIPVVLDPFTLKRFRCDMDSAGMAIGIIGFSFLIFFLWLFLWYTGIPFLSVVFGVIIAYYGWVVAACFFLANVLFIVMGVVLIFKGIIDAVVNTKQNG